MSVCSLIQLGLPDDETKIAYAKSILTSSTATIDDNFLLVIIKKMCQSFKDVDLGVARIRQQ
jgi:hypothetical protein